MMDKTKSAIVYFLSTLGEQKLDNLAVGNKFESLIALRYDGICPMESLSKLNDAYYKFKSEAIPYAIKIRNNSKSNSEIREVIELEYSLGESYYLDIIKPVIRIIETKFLVSLSEEDVVYLKDILEGIDIDKQKISIETEIPGSGTDCIMSMLIRKCLTKFAMELLRKKELVEDTYTIDVIILYLIQVCMNFLSSFGGYNL